MENGIDNVRFNFLYIDTYSFGKTWVYPESVVPYNMLRYIVSGSGTFFIDKEEVVVEKNQIVYIPRGCRMSCYANTDNLVFSSIRFTTSVYFEGVDFLADYYGMPRVMEAKGEEKYFELIDGWVRSSNRGRMYFVRGYLEVLIGSLIERAFQESAQVREGLKTHEEYTLEKLKHRIKKSDSKIDPRIQVVVDYVTLHPTEKYTPESMSQMAELSKQRFSHLFKEQLGKSPMIYIKEIRMTNAARRLLVSDDNVSDIAYSVGYEDPNYFIREFKRYFGYTPNQYRKAARE
ncbi:AraC family transcriptional regulator [Ruminococcus sp. 5_1_39BFAA]|uniref:AraC family transcriptional regulator n=1 Tax=Ruminococcus sp. 5_1_39BFAA TaxID=457412 RepID=UPI0035688B8D